MTIDQVTATPRSRRAILAGSMTGLAVLVARTLGRPDVAEAMDPNDVVKELNNPVTAITELSNSTNDNLVFWGQSTQGGIGIYGSSGSGSGVLGESFSGAGIRAHSTNDNGVIGTSDSATKSGVWGDNTADGYGVSGSTAGSSTAGVWGSNSGKGAGVRGTAVSGRGIHGKSTSGYAGYFEGKIFTTRFFELKEISTPAKPLANRARLFTRDNGSGATQLCVKFSNGTVRVLATM